MYISRVAQLQSLASFLMQRNTQWNGESILVRNLVTWGGNYVLAGGNWVWMLSFEPPGKISSLLKSTEVSSSSTTEVSISFLMVILSSYIHCCFSLSAAIIDHFAMSFSLFPLFSFFLDFVFFVWLVFYFFPPSSSIPVYLTLVNNFR